MFYAQTPKWNKKSAFSNHFILFPDLANEKLEKNLINGIEGFDTSKLKHAETQEKNPLPDIDGISNFNSFEVA